MTESAHEHRRVYLPIMDTLRLYAGWLLAWYAFIFLLGSQQDLHRLPFDIAWVQSIYRSPVILRFACGTFLFLLCTDLYKATGKRAIIAVLLSALWLALIAVFVKLS